MKKLNPTSNKYLQKASTTSPSPPTKIKDGLYIGDQHSAKVSPLSLRTSTSSPITK
jgi:hypothetical protein